MAKIMRSVEFFKKYGPLLVKVTYDSPEFGDYLILDTEIEMAKEYEAKGYTIVSVHEAEDGDWIDMSVPCDYGNQPFKIGYYVINFEE
jgi:hypothetical protein